MSAAAKDAARKRINTERNKAAQLQRNLGIWPLGWSEEDRKEAAFTMLETAAIRLNSRICAPANNTGGVSLSLSFAIEIFEALETAKLMLGSD